MSRSTEAIRLFFRGVGQLLITAGVVVLLFVVYELWITNIFQASSQHHLKSQLLNEWAHAGAHPAALQPLHLGGAIGLLYVPRFGPGYQEVIVEGVREQDLQKGPGHYPGTAMPGQIGNFVVSGHRTTYGAPFNHLDELRPGDPIVIETVAAWFTYDVTGNETVLPDDIAVIAPVPDRPGVRPTQRLLTFTTCTPEYSASHRLVVHGRLVAVQPRSSGPPAVLLGT
jgi:sortase A